MKAWEASDAIATAGICLSVFMELEEAHVARRGSHQTLNDEMNETSAGGPALVGLGMLRSTRL